MAPNDAAIDADSRGFGPGMGPVSPDRGIALVDLLMATAITATLAVLVVPLTESAVMTHEARSAASYLAAGLRETRLAAVTSGRAAALVFDETADGSWTIRRCRDGNGNGVRRAELTGGPDSCLDPQRIDWLFGGVTVGLDPATPGLDEPPGQSAGVRFGTSRMSSCSPAGHCSPGTLYIRSAAGQFAVRIAGISGRTRVFRFDPGQRQWVSL